MTLPQAEAQNEIVLRLDRITKRFGALTANDAITFHLRRGEVVALLGENGAGKTTLMNILFGHYLADEGTVEAFGRNLAPGNQRAALEAGIGMVHQHFTLAENLTVLENILLGTVPLWRLRLGRQTAQEKLAKLAKDFGLHVNPHTRIAELSVGERQRVEILKALYRDAKVLILDEPTAVLTPQETEILFDTLRNAVTLGLSVIFISHKLHEVLEIADRCVVLRHGKIVGEVATSGTDRQALASMMVGAEVSMPDVAPARPGATLLKLDHVSTLADGTAPGLRDVTLDLKAGHITGLAGVSGNGQSALSDLISGLRSPDQGEMSMGNSVIADWSPRRAIRSGIARIPEDRHHTGTIADFDLTENAVLETYTQSPLSRSGWMNWNKAKYFASQVIDTYDVRCPGPDTPIRLLSGGNMQKLILGRVLEGEPQIILANQPVRGLDIGAITYVHKRLLAARDAGAAILLISEDLDEIMQLSDVIHVISDGRLSPGFKRGTKTRSDLGLWMAGQGFRENADAA